MTAILEGEEEAAKSRPHSQDLGPRRGNTLETLPPQAPTEAPGTVARGRQTSF